MRIATALSVSAIRLIAVRGLAIDDDRVEQFSGRAWFLRMVGIVNTIARNDGRNDGEFVQAASAPVSHSLYESSR
jgi:hypothetical protein